MAALTSGHNGGLVAAAAQLGSAIPFATFGILPYDEILTSIISNATLYGFTAPFWQQCYGTVADPIGTDGHAECANPAQHVFWDSVQPTSAAAAVVAATAAKSIAAAFPDIKAQVPQGTPVVHNVQGLFLPSNQPAAIPGAQMASGAAAGPAAGPGASRPASPGQAGESSERKPPEPLPVSISIACMHI